MILYMHYLCGIDRDIIGREIEILVLQSLDNRIITKGVMRALRIP